MSNVIDIKSRKPVEVSVNKYASMNLVSLMKELVQFKNELVTSGRVTREQAEKGLPLLEAIIKQTPDNTMKAWATICYTEMSKILYK